MSTLYIAALTGDVDLVKSLLEDTHFDVNSVEWTGQTPLSLACRRAWIIQRFLQSVWPGHGWRRERLRGALAEKCKGSKRQGDTGKGRETPVVDDGQEGAAGQDAH